MSKQRILKLTLLAGLAVLAGLAGCKESEQLASLADLTDRASLERLASLPETSSIVLSLEGHQAMLPPEPGETGRRLASFDKSFLLEVTREGLPDLAGTPGLKAIVVWGGGEMLPRLDSRLRLTMLSRLSGEELRATPLDAVARFEGEVLDLRHSLEKAGAEVRSARGGIVTLSATVDVLLEVLARPDLVKLEKPVLQKQL